MEYPFEVCIDSLLGFADEVVVVDAGSRDGTIEKLNSIARRDSRVRVAVEPVDFSHPRWAIMQDGLLKGKARALCSGDYCWQTDTDEVVPPEDYPKMDTLPAALAGRPLIMLPMVEFWGDFSKIRGDFFTWKPRFSVNDKRIVHGIPARFKLRDSSGHEYPKPFDSDSCNYIYDGTAEDVPIHIPIQLTDEERAHYGELPPERRRAIFERNLDLFPSVLHVSWLDLPRKIRHYKRYWQAFHASMYNLRIEDTAATNVMFDKPWAEVTEAEIFEKAEQLRQIGPRSFHYKIDPTVPGITFDYIRPIPGALRGWADRTRSHAADKRSSQRVGSSTQAPEKVAVGQSYPLVSVIMPSFNKAKYLSQAVGSIALQRYPNIELLVVNDGSPDNTNEIAEQLARDLPELNIRLLQKQNGGISDARNFGIKHARGSLIVPLDGDDMAKQGFIAKAVERVVAHGDNLICNNVELFGAQPGEWYPNQYDRLGIRYDNCIPTLTLFEKSLWERAGGFNVCFPFVEDWEFWISCSRYNPKVARLEGRYYLYRSSEEGLAHLFTNRYRECLSLVTTSHEDLYAVDEVLTAHQGFPGFPQSWRDRFAKQVELHPREWLLQFWLGLFAEGAGDFNKAASFYARAIELSDSNSWQPVYRLGLLYQNAQKPAEAAPLFQHVRMLRPDMHRLVEGVMSGQGRAVRSESAAEPLQ